MNKKSLLPLSLIGLMIFSSCSSYSFSKHITGTRQVGEEIISPLDTNVEISTYSNEAKKYVDENFDDMIWSLHEELDRYHSYEGVNNLYTINNSIGTGKEVVVSENLFKLIKEGVQLTKMTSGAFNICLGDLIDLWAPKFSNGTMSQAITSSQKDFLDADLYDVLQRIPTYQNIDNYVVLNEKNHSVKLNKIDLQVTKGSFKLDFGAFGKGWVMDFLSEAMKINKYPALVSLGNSSMEMIGDYPGKDSSKWKLNYSNPSIADFKNDRLMTLEFEGGMRISTSSDEEKHYYIYNEKEDAYLMRCHILDGRTGRSNNYYRMVSVLSRDCPNYALDALSITIFNLSPSSVSNMVKAFEDYYDCKIGYILCQPYNYSDINKYNVKISDNIRHYVKESSIIDDIKKLSL